MLIEKQVADVLNSRFPMLPVVSGVGFATLSLGLAIVFAAGGNHLTSALVFAGIGAGFAAVSAILYRAQAPTNAVATSLPVGMTLRQGKSLPLLIAGALATSGFAACGSSCVAEAVSLGRAVAGCALLTLSVMLFLGIATERLASAWIRIEDGGLRVGEHGWSVFVAWTNIAQLRLGGPETAETVRYVCIHVYDADLLPATAMPAQQARARVRLADFRRAFGADVVIGPVSSLDSPTLLASLMAARERYAGSP